ncbi:hypothetical protein ACFQ1Q_05985 [Winogradskyella litorisediminis]|uniref:Uncharacterized protein n=1 Tax=Winogradskyella litorisediminis TaxID=1156618 RepID=A0ABW3N844_9FLAO
MKSDHQHKLALFFALLFITIVAAPTVVVSMDDSADVTIFFGENEEEEKEGFNLIFDFLKSDIEQKLASEHSIKPDAYFFKTYPLPYRNLVSPPPDFA